MTPGLDNGFTKKEEWTDSDLISKSDPAKIWSASSYVGDSNKAWLNNIPSSEKTIKKVEYQKTQPGHVDRIVVELVIGASTGTWEQTIFNAVSRIKTVDDYKNVDKMLKGLQLAFDNEGDLGYDFFKLRSPDVTYLDWDEMESEFSKADAENMTCTFCKASTVRKAMMNTGVVTDIYLRHTGDWEGGFTDYINSEFGVSTSAVWRDKILKTLIENGVAGYSPDQKLVLLPKDLNGKTKQLKTYSTLYDTYVPRPGSSKSTNEQISDQEEKYNDQWKKFDDIFDNIVYDGEVGTSKGKHKLDDHQKATYVKYIITAIEDAWEKTPEKKTTEGIRIYEKFIKYYEDQGYTESGYKMPYLNPGYYYKSKTKKKY